MDWRELAWAIGGMLLGWLSALLKVVMPSYKELLEENRLLREDLEEARDTLDDQRETRET